MATSAQVTDKTDTATAEISLSESLLDTLKQKEECPRCKEKYLYSNDSDAIDDIVNYVCLRCGYAFYENEQQREYRKDKEKDKKESNPWDAGILLALSMLSVILLINLSRRGELPRSLEPVLDSPSINSPERLDSDGRVPGEF